MTADWFSVLDATWPAASYRQVGPVTLREGRGGGSRVSAATCKGSLTPEELRAAEAGMRALGQRPIFQVRPGQDALDGFLESQGYTAYDPVTIYACPTDRLCDVALPRVTVLTVWEPLAIMREIWAEGGIGPERIEVMKRAKEPKTGFLGRLNERPGGVAFAAIHQGVAMVHAVEVVPHQRRAGMGRWFMRAAGFWARDHGAGLVSVMCTDANLPANRLYASLGMEVVGHYHYRHLPTETPPK